MFKVGDDDLIEAHNWRMMVNVENQPSFILGNHVCNVTVGFPLGRGNSCGYQVQVLGTCH